MKMTSNDKYDEDSYDTKNYKMTFDISTGLKRVLGRELITNNEVAIFELVKNSFDANATDVQIYISSEAIWIVDNGQGMTYEDIKSKWLFVAYSSKRNKLTYRDHVSNRQHYAGSKGIGRFSTDRLGRELVLQTRSMENANKIVHEIKINWDLFEDDDKKLFNDIPVKYLKRYGFDIPKCLTIPTHGTAIGILQPSSIWNRLALLKLKSSLAKLINPFGSNVDKFQITIHAPDELKADEQQRIKKQNNLLPKDIVNGLVGNFIFTELQEKTTFLEVEINPEENTIESRLVDRGEQIYKIREANPYDLLRFSGFRCEIYYLNRAAKVTFANRVGLPSVQFGSIFLFRNGFRVFPIGDDGIDWFRIDRRKQQGYARFLGTRELIGRVDVSGDDSEFQEASSRNEGLIDTPSVQEIRQCFWEHCLKRLERYVIPVSWADKLEADQSDLTRLLTDPGRARVTAAIATLIDNEEVELIQYSHKLVGLLDERSEQFERSLVSLRRIAEKTKDEELYSSIENAEQRFEELKQAEAEARRVADLEREAKEAAQKRAIAAEAAVDSYEIKLQEEKKINLFLRSVSTLDLDNVLNMHHQITIYSADMNIKLENFIAGTEGESFISRDRVVSTLEKITFLNKKITTIARFATKANFRLQSEEIDNDLAQYMTDYIEGIACDFSPPGLRIEVTNEHPGFLRSFKPIDISVVIDNFISNANKARASLIQFKIYQPKNRKGLLCMEVKDNGKGFTSGIDTSRLFEKGFTTTDGSGLGLYHVQLVLGDMGGSVRLGENKDRGATFIVEVANK